MIDYFLGGFGFGLHLVCCLLVLSWIGFVVFVVFMVGLRYECLRWQLIVLLVVWCWVCSLLLLVDWSYCLQLLLTACYFKFKWLF